MAMRPRLPALAPSSRASATASVSTIASGIGSPCSRNPDVVACAVASALGESRATIDVAVACAMATRRLSFPDRRVRGRDQAGPACARRRCERADELDAILARVPSLASPRQPRTRAAARAYEQRSKSWLQVAFPTNAVDHVGSLRRPPNWCRPGAIGRQASCRSRHCTKCRTRRSARRSRCRNGSALPIVTDGEFRRGGWSRGFLNAVDGFEFRASKLTFRNDRGRQHRLAGAGCLDSTIRRKQPIVTDDFKFLKSVAKNRIKVTMPTPSHMHFGQFKDAIDRKVYPSDRRILGRHDRGVPAGDERRLRRRLPLPAARRGAAGAPVRQEHSRARAQRGRRSRTSWCTLYVDVLNRAVADRPADLTIGMHLCRGNMEGLWMGDGGYAPIAEALFNRCDVDAFLLEYDSPRAGDFAPLRHLPAGKRAYLGIISTKNPEVESLDALMRRIDEAQKYAPMDRLGICPQCGFSSAAMSKFAILPSKVTTDIQTLKIKRLVEAGQRAWGHA